MKKLSTTKLQNFLRSITFVLVTPPSENLNYHCTLTYDYGAYGLLWY